MEHEYPFSLLLTSIIWECKIEYTVFHFSASRKKLNKKSASENLTLAFQNFHYRIDHCYDICYFPSKFRLPCRFVKCYMRANKQINCVTNKSIVRLSWQQQLLLLVLWRLIIVFRRR